MRQPGRRAAVLLACWAVLLSMSGVALAQSTLRIGLGDDPDVLDPTFSRTYTARIVFSSICDKLFDIDEKLNIVPQLALSHETSEDGKTVTIKLRPGVKFHDGEDFDAAAAKYSLERHLNMKGSFRKPEISAIDSVEVVDPLTIKLHLKAPFSPLLAQLTDRAGMMVAPKAAEAAGDKFGLHPVCAGPYKFVERVQQDRIVVEKFADYWNKDNVFIDKITYLPIVDATVRLANLRSGGLDLIERVLATDIKTVREDKKLSLSKAVSLGWFGLLINVANGPKADNPLGKDPRVRRAFELSLDREALNQVVFNGEFVPGNQWVSPQNPYYQQKFPIPKRDIAKAKALLKEAGVNGRIPIDFMVNNTPETRAVAEVVQSMAAEAGFDLKIRVTEVATALKTAEDGDFQLYENTWSGRSDPDGNSIIYQACGAPQNMGHYCDKEVDALHQQARAASDVAARKAIYEKLTERFLANGWIIYLYHPQVLIAHTDRLQGYTQRPDGLVRVVGLKLK
ncbi:peptide/nickel transport system substrate-binding protein [Enhydrobacter aerosaccus]|uniref:Peptide/nickel transport system substrate-binding protein n=1 Tax=Enhydrobacter aerosaccus TaxID=225324 RepID=A0A1T4SW94_9HYPH|nr:ABC transporter substrate-binding protein [Enhydrobacter aerosaccus]SKA32439.1 peptide/nickel transport system substrate-binding protein [Enhydrobacter aerosaccus]